MNKFFMILATSLLFSGVSAHAADESTISEQNHQEYQKVLSLKNSWKSLVNNVKGMKDTVISDYTNYKNQNSTQHIVKKTDVNDDQDTNSNQNSSSSNTTDNTQQP